MSADQFERKLRDRFAQAEVPPPPALWDQIQAQVQATPPPARRRFLWLWWSLAAVLLLGMGLGLGYVYFGEQPFAAPVTVGLTTPAETPAATPSFSDSVLANPTAPSQSGEGAAQAAAPQPLATTRPSATAATTASPVTAASKPAPALTSHGFLPEAGNSLPANPGTDEGTPHQLPAQSVTLTAAVSQPAPPSLSASVPPALQRLRSGWSLNLYLKQQTAFTTDPSAASREPSLDTDYAGFANNDAGFSDQSSNQQLAKVRFPRQHLALGMEVGKSLHPRWRVSLGLEGRLAFGGTAILGDIHVPTNIGTAFPTNDATSLVYAAENAQYAPARNFVQWQLGAPLRIAYLQPLGTGKLEHSLGWSLNRSGVIRPSLTEEESQIFLESAPNRNAMLQQSPAPASPVLNLYAWHHDLRLRSRWIFRSDRQGSMFLGAELQSQTAPIYGGDAAREQLSHYLGLELGYRWNR